MPRSPISRYDLRGNALGKDGAEVLAETLPSCEVTDLQLQSDLDETEKTWKFFRGGWVSDIFLIFLNSLKM